MKASTVQANDNLLAEQACKDANTALVLSVVSIYASIIPLLGAVTALVAERLAHLTPDVKGIRAVTTKKNIVHYLTPFTFALSVLFFFLYYFMYTGVIEL